MEEVKAYRSASGFLSEDIARVARDEKEFLLKKAVTDFIENEGWSDMSKGDIVDIICENKERLKKILINGV